MQFNITAEHGNYEDLDYPAAPVKALRQARFAGG